MENIENLEDGGIKKFVKWGKKQTCKLRKQENGKYSSNRKNEKPGNGITRIGKNLYNGKNRKLAKWGNRKREKFVKLGKWESCKIGEKEKGEKFEKWGKWKNCEMGKQQQGKNCKMEKMVNMQNGKQGKLANFVKWGKW